jgi:CheY-like chemotaxis protein
MKNNILKLVVVDDSPSSILLYKVSTKKLPVNVTSFNLSAEAFSYLKKHKPDLIILDIIMPGMDGLTLLKKLRDLPSHKTTPVIIMTSKDYFQDRSIAKQLGVVDFLVKPLRFHEINELLGKYITKTPVLKAVKV